MAFITTAEEKVSCMPRAKVVALLESISIQCYDHETDEELRTALWQAVKDGDLQASDIHAAFDEGAAPTVWQGD